MPPPTCQTSLKNRHFAVVGGDPLLGNRYFAGPPDMLKFEAVIAAEVYDQLVDSLELLCMTRCDLAAAAYESVTDDGHPSRAFPHYLAMPSPSPLRHWLI